MFGFARIANEEIFSEVCKAYAAHICVHIRLSAPYASILYNQQQDNTKQTTFATIEIIHHSVCTKIEPHFHKNKTIPIYFMFNNCFLHSKKDMERCTDNRSTTPPLNSKYVEPKLRENGKTIVSSLYDKDDEIDISQTSIANDTLHVSITPHSSKLRFEFLNYNLNLQSKKFRNDNFQSNFFF